MSQLLAFYRGQAPDHAGRWLEDIWKWDDDRLEHTHDFIQWLFPLPEPSRFNPDAPLLTPADQTAFHQDEQLRANLRRSFTRMLDFLGLTLTADNQVVEAPHFLQRVPEVWQSFNHNWLRITRMLRSLCLLGLPGEAQALYTRLADWYQRRRFPIPADTFRYWTEAVQSAPPAKNR